MSIIDQAVEIKNSNDPYLKLPAFNIGILFELLLID
jgi:hypothetical protein